MNIPRPVFHSNICARHAYSLVEMSVVITIIGLIVGGIMVGKSMVHNSQLQTTVSKVQEYAAATLKFRDRFNSLPGDMPNATSLWGSVSTGTATCDGPFTYGDPTFADGFTTAGTSTATCNGNGDGRVGANTTTCYGDSWEVFRAWKHLLNAEFITGSYSGYHGAQGNHDAIVGTNIPTASLGKGGYTLVFCGSKSSDASLFDGDYGHVIMLGSAGKTTGVGEFSRLPLFTTEEAGAIDKKLDDSYPHTGKVVAPQSDDTVAPDCTTSASAAPGSADYKYSNTASAACPLLFKLGF